LTQGNSATYYGKTLRVRKTPYLSSWMSYGPTNVF